MCVTRVATPFTRECALLSKVEALLFLTASNIIISSRYQDIYVSVRNATLILSVMIYAAISVVHSVGVFCGVEREKQCQKKKTGYGLDLYYISFQ